MIFARRLPLLLLLPCVLFGCRQELLMGPLDGPIVVEPEPSRPPADSFELGECSRFSYTPENCSGSPENPSCTESFSLREGGGGDYLLDDIVTDLKWTRTDATITVEVPEIGKTYKYVIAEDNVALIDKGGARYEQRDC